MISKRLLAPVVLAATTALVVGLSPTSASADLVPGSCYTPNNIEVLYAPDGNIRYACFAGLGYAYPYLENVAWITAGQYRTIAFVQQGNNLVETWINPGQKHVFGHGNVVELGTI